MKSKYNFGPSLRKLPWTDKDQTKSQSLISSTILEWYDAKHRITSDEEIEFINSIERPTCPYCESTSFIKYCFRNKIRVFKYKNCNRKFTNLTNTIFDSKKIPISEWIEYLLHLFEYHSITTSSRDNRNASTTGRYWLKKVFRTLEKCQNDVKLKGTVYLDEIFFSVISSKIETKDGKKLRGISRNKICVGVALDKDSLFIKVENTSKPSDLSTWNTFGLVIEKGSHLIHDKEKSHNVLIERLNLTSETYDSSITKGLKDNENPLDPINNIFSY